MTRERAKELLPVIEAWARGEVVQVRHKKDAEAGYWRDVEESASPEWLDQFDYRIKPRPLECWAVWCPADAALIHEGRVFSTRAEVEQLLRDAAFGCGASHRIVHMREVVE